MNCVLLVIYRRVLLNLDKPRVDWISNNVYTIRFADSLLGIYLLPVEQND